MTQLTEIPCGLCSTAFVPKQRTQKFCSKTCGSRFHDQQREIRDKDKRLAKSRAYYANNTEQHKRAQKSWATRNADHLRQYREMNREQRVEYMKQWHSEHRDESNAKRLALHYENRDEANRTRREHYHAHSEENKPVRYAKSQAARLTVPWRGLIHAARWRAAKKGVPFDLTPEWAEENWTGICTLSGIPFRLGGKESGPKFFSPSIDRIIPSLGYVQTNCRFVLWAVNAMKYDGTDTDLYDLAEAILLQRTVLLRQNAAPPNPKPQAPLEDLAQTML